VKSEGDDRRKAWKGGREYKARGKEEEGEEEEEGKEEQEAEGKGDDRWQREITRVRVQERRNKCDRAFPRH